MCEEWRTQRSNPADAASAGTWPYILFHLAWDDTLLDTLVGGV
jgi:hypothetical protein